MHRPIYLSLELGAQNQGVSTKASTGGTRRTRTGNGSHSSTSSSLTRTSNKIKEWINGVTGRIQVAIRVSEEHEVGEGERRRNIFVEIERCIGLKNAGSTSGPLGRPSRSSVAPFISIQLNGKEVGRTPPVKVTKNQCTWIDECYEFPVCAKCQTLQLQAWNVVTIGGQVERIGDFLGQATILIASIRGAVVGETKDLDLELKRWSEDTCSVVDGNEHTAADTSSSASSPSCCCCCPENVTGPLHCPVSDSETRHNAADLIHVKSSNKWSVKKRRGSFFYARPENKDTSMGRYRVDNPHPYRRRDIREVADDDGSSSSCVSSTLSRALGLICVYLLFGVIGFSFCFEKLSVLEGLYLSVVTFTTVGYGDERPVTVGGKLFSCVFALAGIGIIGIALGYIGQNIIQAQVVALQMANRRSVRESMKETSSKSEAADGSNGGGDGAAPQAASSLESADNMKAGPGRGLLRHPATRQLLLSLFPIIAIILLGSLVVGSYEGWNWVDSIYWCVVTGTSVGYGDLYPRSDDMRWFSVLYIPLAVGAFSAALGRIANVFVEAEIRKSNKKLLEREVTVEDLETMNVDGDGEVSVLEFVEHMLKAMNKVDQTLLDDLHSQFDKLDADGSGGLQNDDLGKSPRGKFSLILYIYTMKILRINHLRIVIIISLLLLFSASHGKKTK